MLLCSGCYCSKIEFKYGCVEGGSLTETCGDTIAAADGLLSAFIIVGLIFWAHVEAAGIPRISNPNRALREALHSEF